MELNEELLDSVRLEFRVLNDSLREVAAEILDTKTSDYPMFIFHTESIDLGKMLYNHLELSSTWDVSVSILEEFVFRKVVLQEKVADFKSTFKNPREYACLFVIEGVNAYFVFIPYE